MDWQRRTWRERVGGQEVVLEGIADFDEACADLARRARDPEVVRNYQSLCPMFGVIWPSARGLAQRLAALPLDGVTLLELGCGLALPSLVAARGGAQVTATDQHPDTAAYLSRNAAHNAVDVRYASFDWLGELPAGVPERGFARVVASDVLYTHEMPAAVAAAFARFLAPDGVGWLTDPGRPWLVEFTAACEAQGLAVVDDVVAGADGRDEVFLFEVRWR